MSQNAVCAQKACCVPGCLITKEDGVPLHQFPNPEKNPEKFHIWITNIGGELTTLDVATICNNRRICHHHFKDVHKYPKDRLCQLATPVLNLPGGQVLRELDHVSGGYHIPNFGDTSMNVEQSRNPLVTSEDQTQSNDRVGGDVNKKASTLTFGDTQNNAVQSRNLMAPSEHQQSHEKNILPNQNVNKQRERGSHIKKDTKKYKGPHISLSQMKQYKLALKKLQKCEKEKKSFKCKYIAAKKLMKTSAFQIMCKNMSPSAKLFCQMQVNQSGKKKQGRRFTIDEKILALSLYKPSPKAYRLLGTKCIMPSRRTLQNLLRKINLKPGINEFIFENLKQRTDKMPETHKYCSLLFDEMAIGPGVFYNKTHDKLTGFVDNGIRAEKDFCDHVLVFMVRGILKKYKQHLAYYFCSGSTKTIELKTQIEKIIMKLEEAGLKVVATVCDQGTSNVAAINALIKQTQEKYMRKNQMTHPQGTFEIGNAKIFPIYDPPHLIKGIRNNLITKNLKYSSKGKECVAKWSHIVALYNKSPGYQGVKLVPKLTAQHVLPALIPKMRVKHCTQVFSKSVGVALGFMAEMGAIEKEATDTADLLLFFDDVFDSVNGSYSDVKSGKIYRAAVTPTSPHHKLWNESLKVLKTMKFENAQNQGVVPSLSSWIKTLENFKNLAKYLSAKGITSLLLRNINQDPLENFFGSVRAHGCSNIMPTASAFESAFKTLLVNNISSPHSVGANCEKDENFCLNSLKKYLTTEAEDNQTTECECEIDGAHLCIEFINTEELLKSTSPAHIEKSAAIGYCSGWLVQLAKENVFTNCQICLDALETEVPQTFHEFIKKKEFENKRWLCYPTRALFDFFAQVENICAEVLKTDCNRKNILTYLRLIINVNIDVTFINCAKHETQLRKYLIDKSTLFCLNNWCKEINNVLTGKTNNCNNVQDLNNPIIEKALRHYSKNKGRKRTNSK